MVDNITANRAYQLPDPTNNISYDIYRIISAFTSVDADVASVIGILAGKADSLHDHTVQNILGLQALLDAKVGANSPNFSGQPTAPTAATADNSTLLATTAFVKAQLYATRASPTFTGTPTAPTPAIDDNSTKLATTAYVKGQAGPTGFAPIVSPTFTGTPAAPTPPLPDSSTRLATTAFVKGQNYISTLTATAVEFRENLANRLLSPNVVWESAVPVTIAYAAVIYPDMKLFINAKTLLTGNTILGGTGNIKKGQMGMWEFRQDGTGNRTLSYDVNFYKAPQGFALSTTPNAIDYVSYYTCDDGKILLNIIKNPA